MAFPRTSSAAPRLAGPHTGPHPAHALETLERRSLLSLPWATTPGPSPIPDTTGGSTVAADFDGDGHIDLAVADEHTLRFLKGNGDGTFQPAVSLTLAANIGGLVVGRIGGDGRPDIASVVQMPAGRLLARVFYFNPALGRFTVGARLSIPGGSAAPGYFGDVTPNLLVGNTFGGWRNELIITYLGNIYEVRALTRSRLAVIFSSTLPRGASDLKLADLDGNGQEKLLFLIKSNGNGVATLSAFTFGEFPGSIRTLYASASIYTYGVADMNGDGVPDIFLTESSFIPADPPTLTLLVRNSSGAISRRTTWAWPGALTMEHGGTIVDIQDVNGDGRMDVLFQSYNETSYYYSTDVESALVVLTARANGGWDAETGWTTSAQGYYGLTYPTISQDRFRLASLSGNTPDLLDQTVYDGQLTRAASAVGPGAVHLLGGSVGLYPSAYLPPVGVIAHVSAAGACSDFGGAIRCVEIIWDANDNGAIDAGEVIVGTADASTVSGNVFRVTALLPPGAAPGTPLHLLARAVALDGTYSDAVDLGTVMIPT